MVTTKLAVETGLVVTAKLAAQTGPVVTTKLTAATGLVKRPTLPRLLCKYGKYSWLAVGAVILQESAVRVAGNKGERTRRCYFL